jgi:hypothetical protein
VSEQRFVEVPSGVPAPGTARLWRRWVRRYGESPEGAIFGTVVTAAVVGGEAVASVDVVRVVETIAVTIPLYWLTHAYATVLTEHMRRPVPPSWRDARHALVEEATVLESALPPLALLLVMWLADVSAATTLTACLWLCVADLFTFGWVAGSRGGLRGRPRLGYAFGAGAFGVAIIVMKTLLH